MSWKDVADGAAHAVKRQLLDHDRNFVIDFTRNPVRGALPSGNLAPIDFNAPTSHFTGILTLPYGGTSADLSGLGPGVLKIPSPGAPVEVGGFEYTDVDWASGVAEHGQALIYNVTGPTAEFGPLNLSLPDATSGLLGPDKGGTGVNNGSNTLTIPATGTAALLGTAQTFSADQTINAVLAVTAATSPAAFTLADAATATASPSFFLRHHTSATPTVNFGTGFAMEAHSSTNTNRNLGQFTARWTEATDASRKAQVVLFVSDTTLRTAMVAQASGAAAMIGFLGAAAVARQNITGTRTGTLAQLQTVMANLLTGLANLGLITDSTT